MHMTFHVKGPLDLSEFKKTEMAHFLEKFQEDPFNPFRIAISVKKDRQGDSKRHSAGLRTHLKAGYYVRQFRL
jgi:hypothetical protein